MKSRDKENIRRSRMVGFVIKSLPLLFLENLFLQKIEKKIGEKIFEEKEKNF